MRRGSSVKLAFTFDQSTRNGIECDDANGNVLMPIKQMPFLAHFWVYEFLPRALGLAGIGSFIFVAGGMAYFLIRDTFRFGRFEPSVDACLTVPKTHNPFAANRVDSLTDVSGG